MKYGHFKSRLDEIRKIKKPYTLQLEWRVKVDISKAKEALEKYRKDIEYFKNMKFTNGNIILLNK